MVMVMQMADSGCDSDGDRSDVVGPKRTFLGFRFGLTPARVSG